MTLEQIAAMTLDQICDGGPYPAATDVRNGTATGLPSTNGSCSVPTAANVKYGVAVDATTGTLQSVVICED